MEIGYCRKDPITCRLRCSYVVSSCT